MKPTELESQFDHFMFGIDFTRVSEDIGSSPSFANADYVHKLNNIVVELKILEKDFLEQGGVIDSLHTFIARPKKIDTNGIGLYELQVPMVNREGTLDNFEEPLRRILKKANKQIGETKKYYFYDKLSYGFVIIALLGLDSIPTIMVTQVICKILNQEFSNIEGAIICKPFKSKIGNSNLFSETECHSISKELPESKDGFCKKIANSWVSFLESGWHK
jgi:hypothetical protein